ncbi:hypothetical protein [Haloechinothrix sp. LS1_15]|uniref:hypothetical protein n=1 Tax=Haloechinothrix sp. LS1_15 TaxID=2652248 RepID=UPI0029442D6B|nr:hypothetical protein [Haloechinothrix sp. LS1_15]MDV6011406.1 hypothetical protein [Haloechinothrix sp. LS1_15]
MTSSPAGVRRVLASTTTAALVAGGMMVGVVATAHAAEEDPRAERHDGNVKTCEYAELGGEIIAVWDEKNEDLDNLEISGGEPGTDTHLTISGLADGVEVTGIVVKGGPAYNIYEPGERGLDEGVSWEDLRAPLVANDNIPEISHWFACGEPGEEDEREPEPTPTGEPEPSDKPAPEKPEKPEKSDGEETSTEPEESTDPEPTGTTDETSEAKASTSQADDDVTPAAQSDALADTGFGGASLIWVGALLLLGGGAALYLARSRFSSAGSQ